MLGRARAWSPPGQNKDHDKDQDSTVNSSDKNVKSKNKSKDKCEKEVGRASDPSKCGGLVSRLVGRGGTKQAAAPRYQLEIELRSYGEEEDDCYSVVLGLDSLQQGEPRKIQNQLWPDQGQGWSHQGQGCPYKRRSWLSHCQNFGNSAWSGRSEEEVSDEMESLADLLDTIKLSMESLR